MNAVLHFLAQLFFYDSEKSVAAQFPHLFNQSKYGFVCAESCCECFPRYVQDACPADVIQSIVKDLAGLVLETKDVRAVCEQRTQFLR